MNTNDPEYHLTEALRHQAEGMKLLEAARAEFILAGDVLLRGSWPFVDPEEDAEPGEDSPAPLDTVPAEPTPPAPPPMTHTGVCLRPMNPVVLGYESKFRAAAFSRGGRLMAEGRVAGGSWHRVPDVRVEHGVTVLEADLSGLKVGDVFEVRAGDRTISQTVGQLGVDWHLGSAPEKRRNIIIEDELFGGSIAGDFKGAWFRGCTFQHGGDVFTHSRPDDPTLPGDEVYIGACRAIGVARAWQGVTAIVNCTVDGASGDVGSLTPLIFGLKGDDLRGRAGRHGDIWQWFKGKNQPQRWLENLIAAGVHVTDLHFQPGQFEGWSGIRCAVMADWKVTRSPDAQSGLGIYIPSEHFTFDNVDLGRTNVSLHKVSHTDGMCIGGSDRLRAAAQAAGWAVTP